MSPANAEPPVATESKVKLEHMTASVVGKEKASRQADIRKLQDTWDKKGEEELFAAEVEENIDEKQPNFEESRLVLASFVNSPNPNIQRRGRELTSKLNILQEIAEKRDPGAVEQNALPDAHVQILGKAIAEIPAVVAALAKESGTTIAAVKLSLEQGGITRGSRVGKLLEGMVKNERFLSILNKDIGSIEYTEELVGLEADINSREQQIASKQRSINGDRSTYTNQQGTGGYDIISRLQNNPNNVQGFVSLQRSVAEYSRIQGSFNNNILQQNQLGRTQLGVADIQQYQNDIDRVLQQKGVTAGQANITRTALQQNPQLLQNVRVMAAQVRDNVHVLVEDPQLTASLRSEILTLADAYDNASRINNIYNANANFDQDYANYNLFVDYNKANGERDKLDRRQAELDQETSELRKLRVRRDKQLNAFGQKINRVLNKSVKDYYNKTLLGQAQKLADYEASQKADEAKDAQDMKEKRERISESILKKYLMRTYFKYSGTDITGWEDNDIKKFVKSDILSSTPGKMGKDLLKRVYSMRGSMPPEHRKEIDALFKDMGVTAGPPPVSGRDVIDSLDLEKCEAMAAEFVPNVMGMAQERGYYFDRLKLKQPQMEYLLRTYGEDFFAKVITAKKAYAGEVAKMYNDGGEYNEFMDNGVLSMKKIKNVLAGKDWTQGVKRLWKLAGILGTAYLLGGGLALPTGLIPATPLNINFAAGLTAVESNVTKVAEAALQTAGAVSRLSGKAVDAVAGGLGTGMNSLSNP